MALIVEGGNAADGIPYGVLLQVGMVEMENGVVSLAFLHVFLDVVAFLLRVAVDAFKELLWCHLVFVFVGRAADGDHIVFRRVAPDKHLAVLKQVIQLAFIAADLFIRAVDLSLVFTQFQIHLTFCGNITGGHDEESQFARFVEDRK